MHEVITLQFGQKSNYLATHFWNTQESYFSYSGGDETIVDHDILFKPGIGVDGADTFTPRTVIYDQKSEFGSLRKINALYENEDLDPSQAIWNKPAIIQRNTPIEKCAYQLKLENGLESAPTTLDSARYWSDFNRVYYHPKSIAQLHDYELSSSTSTQFEKWDAGEELFLSMDKEHDFLERDMRPFVEEADRMQAIQMITSVDDVWGGFSARYLDQVKDEYGKTGTLIWALQDSLEKNSREKLRIKISNTAKSISEMASQASLFVPVSLPSEELPPYVTIDKSSRWHVSALLSAAVESITLHTRLKPINGYRMTFDYLENFLNTNGHQNIARLRLNADQTALTFNSHNENLNLDTFDVSKLSEYEETHPRNPNQCFSEVNKSPHMHAYEIDFFTSKIEQQMTQHYSKKMYTYSQIDSLRKELQPEELEENCGKAQNLTSIHPKLKQLRNFLHFPLLDSFPPIFNQASSSFHSIAVATSLTIDTTIASRLKGLQCIVNRSIGIEDRELLTNSIGELAEAYVEGWESDSDEGEDI